MSGNTPITSLRRKLFGLNLAEKKECYREMCEYVGTTESGTGAAERMRAVGEQYERTMDAALQACEKWRISGKQASGILRQGKREGWSR